MDQVERHIHQKNKPAEQLCFNAARLYNFCNYHKRQAFFGKLEKFGEYELSGLLAEFNQEDFRSLPSTCSQQVIKNLFRDWNVYFSCSKSYKKNKSLFKCRPKPPGYYDKKGHAMCVFVKSQLHIKSGYIHFPKRSNLKPLKTKVNNIKQVRIIPQTNCFVFEVVYEQKIIKHAVNKKKFLALDPGLNNFVTSVNNAGAQPFIINGKVLKSVNQMYNKTKAELMSYVGNKGTSNRIKKLTFYRNNFIEDKLHKISRYIVNYCLKNKIGNIIIGKNKQWKDSINIGRENNQKFVCIPHARLFDKIKYKAELVGIKVIETEESYSSKTDHLAGEKMEHHKKYLGVRKHRGLFQSSKNKLINADINGAIGIARKVFGNSAVKQIVDSGLAFNPVKLNLV